MKISIIVPVYNSSLYLDKCVNSLLSQTLSDIEIILVNDGSTDGSLDKMKSYKDARIKVFSKENGGQGSARNLGLSYAKGEYILFVDSDDYIDSNTCYDLYEFANSKKCDIVVCDYYINENNIDRYNKILNDHDTSEISGIDYLFSEACPWNKLYKRSFLIDNNFSFPEGIMYEDFAVIPMLVKYNPKVYYLNKAFLHYVYTDMSTMRSMKYKSKYEDIFKAGQMLYDALKDYDCKLELEYLLVRHMLYHSALNFYRFKKYDQIDKIAEYIKEVFPNYRKNKYIRNLPIKDRILIDLFYYKKYGFIRFVQRLKGRDV